MKRLKILAREPVILFFLLGTFLYISYNQLTNYFDSKSREIIVDQNEILLLEESFRKTWNREPTQNEIDNLIGNRVMDEIFFKEAVAMGLDKTDPAVKRRLRQIMELMLDNFSTIYPTESQLRKYLSENPEKFQKAPRLSFRHLYFPLEDKQIALEFLSGLQKGITKPEDHPGGLYLIPSSFEDESQNEIERLFGEKFSQEILAIEVGSWKGPVESAYGWHLLKVSDFVDSELPPLDKIWDAVEREWSVERKKEIKDEQYKVLRDHYDVTVVDLKR